MDRQKLATAIDSAFRLSPRRVIYLIAPALIPLTGIALGDTDLQLTSVAVFMAWIVCIFLWVTEGARRIEVRAAADWRLQMDIDEAVHEDNMRRIHERFDQLRGRPAKGPWAIRDVRVFPVGDELEERRRRRASLN